MIDKRKVYILLIDGFELVEAMMPVDVLRRGGVDIKTVSMNNAFEVTSSNNVKIYVDMLYDFNILKDGDLLILPGGYPGYERLGNNNDVLEILEYFKKSSKKIAAICGAPIVLYENGVLNKKKFTCHKSILHEMEIEYYKNKKVVVDENIITSQGAGTSLEFSFKILEILCGLESVKSVASGMEIQN